MEQSFGLHFFLRKSKKKDRTDSIIYLRITVDGESREMSTTRKCMPYQWRSLSGRMEGKSDEAKLVNGYLDTLQQKVFEAKRKLLERDTEVTAENIKALLLGIDIYHKKRMIMEVFSKHNSEMKELIGKQYAPATFVRFDTTFRHTQNFLKWKYGLQDLDIRKIDYEFITEYEFWFRSVRNCDHNTTMKYLGNFRKIVNRCLRFGWLPKDPFMGFKMGKKEVERVPLNESELQLIAEKCFDIPRLEIVKDIFLFSCYTGLAYIDVKHLKRADIISGNEGAEWLINKRQKTNSCARIPLLQVAKNILIKYENFAKGNNGTALLPALSNQKMNSYLKEIADACGIKKQLTFHIARHTFATTVTLSNGVPIETVSKMLGHKDIRTTQLYAKIVDKKIEADMKLVKEKYSR